MPQRRSHRAPANPIHVEGERFQGSPPSENPAAHPFNIEVSIPESISIRMVNASALEDYEIWLFISSLLSAACVGFFIAYLQASDTAAPSATPIKWMFIILLILFVICSFKAIRMRILLRKRGRKIMLKTIGASIVEPPKD